MRADSRSKFNQLTTGREKKKKEGLRRATTDGIQSLTHTISKYYFCHHHSHHPHHPRHTNSPQRSQISAATAKHTHAHTLTSSCTSRHNRASVRARRRPQIFMRFRGSSERDAAACVHAKHTNKEMRLNLRPFNASFFE